MRDASLKLLRARSQLVESVELHWQMKVEKAWCREREFIFWRPDFSSVIAKFRLLKNFRAKLMCCFGPI
jgi:hypothetical protein